MIDIPSETKMLEISEQLHGWLRQQASIVSYNLIQSLPDGPAMEIGVWRGKFLSVIRSAIGSKRTIVGYDIFENNQQRVIQKDFKKLFGKSENLVLSQTDSTTLSSETIMDDCGGRPVVISIDGSHVFKPVLCDIHISEKVLHPDGIIIADDFLNPFAIGVNEAIHKHFAGSSQLAPFAFVTNKLFLCHRSKHAEYMARVEKMIRDRPKDPLFKMFFDREAKDQNSIRELFGYPLLIVTG